MEIKKPAKLFAFKLATQQDQAAQSKAQWKVREGVSVAGCSGPDMYENYRADIDIWGRPKGWDQGYYC